jgi:hypothetical protein
MKMSKESALKKIEELKKYVKDEEKSCKKIGFQIKIFGGEIKFESEKTTLREAIIDADLRDADLRDADLREADLSWY